MITEWQKLIKKYHTGLKYSLLLDKNEVYKDNFYIAITIYVRHQTIPILQQLTGISQKKLKVIIKEHNKQIEKIQAKRSKLKINNSQILSIKQLDQWAYNTWKNKGCPRFKKRIVTGIIYGEGYVKTNEKCGWDREILKRYIGVESKKDPNTKRRYIKFNME